MSKSKKRDSEPRHKPVTLSRGNPSYSAKQFKKAKHPHLLCYQQDFVSWDGAAFRTIDDDTIKSEIHSFLRSARVKALAIATTPDDDSPEGEGAGGEDTEKKTLPFNPKDKDVNEVYKALVNIVHVAPGEFKPPCWIGDDHPNVDPKNLIACNNCLVDVRTGETYKSTPAFFTRNALKIDYKKNAGPPKLWEKFLSQALAGDQEMIDLLQEAFGYSLSSDRSLQAIFFPIGRPGSGKGTMLRILVALAGGSGVHGNVASPTIEDLGKAFGLEPLLDKSIGIISDMTCLERDKISTAASRLNLISGEDSVSVSRKYKKALEALLMLQFWIASNNIPDFGEHAAAIARRLIMMAFDVVIEEKDRDRHLTKKLIAELPQILLWAIKGLQRLNARDNGGRFVIPEKCEVLKSRMLHLADPVRGFLEERLIVETDAVETKMVIYSEYKRYAESIGSRATLSLPKLAEKLYRLIPGLGDALPRSETGRVPMFKGIRLRRVGDERRNLWNEWVATMARAEPVFTSSAQDDFAPAEAIKLRSGRAVPDDADPLA